MDAGHQEAPIDARTWVGCDPEIQSVRQQAGSYEERSKAAEGSSTGSAATARKQSPPAWLQIVGARLSGVGASLLAIRAR
ncbi:hypothetical protein CXF92_03265 [Pseudomonas sp. Choline-3u-10]|nr:hypothetical protein RT21_19750 [Pseudomonas sp. 10B238]PKG95874.1 hypothetical protein CXF92_03265 [Pseudomonas sp. Choline-3u-10]HBM10670.1 hypothetical protein [Pseudomonas sp.]